MSDKYSIDYFINKFEEIPDDKWTTGMFYNPDNERCCALGHCGIRQRCELGAPSEGRTLLDIFDRHGILSIGRVNDLACSVFPQSTPKARILAALRSFKAKE